MTDTPKKVPQGVILAFVADIVALALCLVSTVVDDVSPWPAFIVALLAFVGAGLIWLRLKREGNFHPLATSAWALGFSAVAWSIGLIAAAA